MKDSCREINMYGRAVKERWPIVETDRPQIVAELTKVVLQPGYSPRSRIAAARVLKEMDSLNLRAEELKSIEGMNPIAIIRERSVVMLDGQSSRVDRTLRIADQAGDDDLQSLADSVVDTASHQSHQSEAIPGSTGQG